MGGGVFYDVMGLEIFKGCMCWIYFSVLGGNIGMFMGGDVKEGLMYWFVYVKCMMLCDMCMWSICDNI